MISTKPPPYSEAATEEPRKYKKEFGTAIFFQRKKIKCLNRKLYIRKAKCAHIQETFF
jgi:hypothetical protein